MSKVKKEKDYGEVQINGQPIRLEIESTNDYKEIVYTFKSKQEIEPHTFAATLMVLAKELCEMHGVVLDNGGAIEFESDGHTH